MSRRKFRGDTRSLVNTRVLQLECARVLHETLLKPVHLYGDEAMVYRLKKKAWIRAVQMDYLKGLLCIRRMDKGTKYKIKESYEGMKEVEERIDESVKSY